MSTKASRPPRIDAVLLTCEHGGNRVPVPLRPQFSEADAALQGHRGFDAGALQMARRLRRVLAAPLVAATTTRLVVDLNRSETNPRVFSEFTRNLDRSRLLDTYWRPHRARVDEALEALLAKGRVLHLACHSMGAEVDGHVRAAEVSLLYDPSRRGERRFCTAWKSALGRGAPEYRVRRNYPFLGVADGLTTHLRRRYSEAKYLGIELELNQGVLLSGAVAWRALMDAVSTSLLETLER